MLCAHLPSEWLIRPVVEHARRPLPTFRRWLEAEEIACKLKSFAAANSGALRLSLASLSISAQTVESNRNCHASNTEAQESCQIEER